MPHATQPTSGIAFDCFTAAQDVPAVALAALEARGVQANPILPFLYKCRSGAVKDQGNYWFVVYTSARRSQVLYLASCTATSLGDYPLFILTTMEYSELADDVLDGDMHFLSKHLQASLGTERIYSVFAIDLVAVSFAREWYKVTGIQAYRKPFYDCRGSFCTAKDLKPRRQRTILSNEGISYELRKATKADIEPIAILCEQFAEESEPFVMTPSHAHQEAVLLVEQDAVWVHRIRRGGPEIPWEIASIAACTRNTESVATITKVYTDPQWRRLGCAERLTREVCRQLFAAGKEKVALFVGNTNPAKIVYDKVGFLGLRDDLPQVDGVYNWLEVGFDKRFVRQGHW